jgi:hypothetical protein
MSNFLQEAREIATQLINVRYKNADAYHLAARCRAWLAAYEAECGAVLQSRDTRTAINSALDLLDAAKWRIEGALINAIEISAKQKAAA